jgi:glutaminyl-peptide cyclotransferase
VTLRKLGRQLARRLPNGRREAVGGGLFNIVGSLPGKGKPIVVGAHYDTKDGIPGFVGANDGAGGTAAVLEIARVMRRMDRGARDRISPPLRFVLFDGEEATDDQDFYGTGLRGSKAYVRRHGRRTRMLILLDFVADKDLSLPREAGSDPALWERLRAAARRAGVGRYFPDETRPEILDDHTPFARAGIPAIDLIDFDYPYWHTPEDTVDKVSEKSLDASGEAVVELLRGLLR